MARFKDHAAAVGGTRTDQMSLPPWEIGVDHTWNPRDPETQAVKDYIRELADMILNGGWNPAIPILVRWDGNKAWVRDGFCRLTALALAREEGKTIELVKCDLTAPMSNEIDDLYIPLATQTKLPLTQAGWMQQIARLVEVGQTEKMIIKRLGKKPDFVQRLIELAEAPTEISQAVREGNISPTLAVDTMRRHGQPAAVKIVKEAREHARGEDRERIRPRDVDAVVRPRTTKPSIKSRATELARIYEKLQDKDALPLALRAALDDLVEEVRYETGASITTQNAPADLTLTNGELHVHGLSESASSRADA